MRRLQWGLFLAGVFAFQTAQAATVAVTITGQAETAYELNVSGIRKSGRLGPPPGPATIRAVVDIGQRDQVTAGLTFSNLGGVLATCPDLQVVLEKARPLCEPVFVLTGEPAGLARPACVARCQARKRAEEDREDDDEDEVLYTWGSTPLPEPAVDGWSSAVGDTMRSQSFYTSSMFRDAARLLYSRSQKEPLDEPKN